MVTPSVLDEDTVVRLSRITAWDGDLVGAAAGTFGDVVERMTSWRARLDGLGRALGDAECWSGRAADEAAASVLELSRVAAAVQAAFGRSQEGWSCLHVAVRAAQALAERALASGAVAGAGLPGWSGSDPAAAAALAANALAANALAEDALAAASVARAAARRAADEVTGPAVPGRGWSRPDVPDLQLRMGPWAVPTVPDGLSVDQVAGWWAALSLADQEALVRQTPAAVGSLDGVPAWARSQANRLLLHDVLADPGQPPGVAAAARLVEATLHEEEEAGRTVQLQLLDLAGGAVVISFGDLDQAGSVALLVPGILTTPDGDLGALTEDARAVAAASVAAAPAMAVAAVVWLGYRTPQTPWAILGRAASRSGGRALDAALDGLAAARTGVGRPPARTTVLAHSYGTVVVGEAAERPGRLAAEAVVLLGSPGMAVGAAELEVDEVYDAGTIGDPISWAGWFGIPPGFGPYGSTGLPTDPWARHSEYYDVDRPTLAAIGEVVVDRGHDD